MLTGGLEVTIALFIMVRLVHVACWDTWNEGGLRFCPDLLDPARHKLVCYICSFWEWKQERVGCGTRAEIGRR